MINVGRGMVVAVFGAALGLVAAACGGGSPSGCTHCQNMVACCLAEADAGAPMGGDCVNNPGEVTSRQAQLSSCLSDPGVIQGDANSTCQSEFSAEGSKAGVPAACQNI